MAKRMTIAEFKEKAKEKFKNKFNYDKVSFIHSQEAVPITCPIHGEFLQIPFLHLKSKHGCPYCAGVGKITTDDFIKEAQNIHGNKYTYDKAEYYRSNQKLIVTCAIHGDFEITPVSHISKKQGCPECSGKVQMNRAKFIEYSKQIHGKKYTYDKAEYSGSKQKLIITCTLHGDFVITPSAHIRRQQGCPECSGRIQMDRDKFIERSKDIHGKKYDYSKVQYKNTHSKVCIICKVEGHGEFWQVPSSHINGCGCPVCGRKKLADALSMSTEEFIKKAKQNHGEKYTYENTIFIRSNRKVKINCPEHGEFEQQANSHLAGNGCPKCGYIKNHNSTRKTANVFIIDARKTHGEKYDYSKVQYKNTHSKVCIICKVEGHGEFWQEPNAHIRGNGCPVCAIEEKKYSISKTTEEFIKDAKKVHGGKYDYSKVDYKSTHKKVLVTCLTHGDFKQTPGSHLSGNGCPKCGGSFKMTFDYFIKKATVKHGTTYDYSKVDFKSRNDEVTIICPVHGEFKQKPSNHARSGCPLCGGSYNLNTKQFIEKAKLVHDNFYSYENAVYKNSSTKIEINCPYHGSFFQLPSSHLKGHGCPTCRNSRGEFRIEKYLKQIQVSYDNQYTFEDCKNVYPLPFDFAVFIENKIGLIEFNGEQHYREIDFSYGKESRSDLENIKLRDRIKKEYCENNNFPLLIIRYDQLDEINKLVNEFVTKIMDT